MTAGEISPKVVGMAQSSPTTAAGSSPPSIEVDSALPAASAALQSPFTPGPWTFGFEPYEDGCPYIRIAAGEDGYYNQETGIGFNLSGIASEADGRLMATALELYEALGHIVENTDWGVIPDRYMDAARAALAKARGQA